MFQVITQIQMIQVKVSSSYEIHPVMKSLEQMQINLWNIQIDT